MVRAIGIDAGGTLTKIAYINEEQQLILKHEPSTNLQEVAAFIDAHPEVEKVGLTGGRAEQLRQLVTTEKEFAYVVEFEATLKGVRFLLERENIDLKRAIITNIGSGTSVHYMNDDTYKRVSGTGIGGGTLIGLSALLTGVFNYNEMSELAQQGSRKSIDLMVADIFKGQEIPAPLHPDLTASNFGKVGIDLRSDYKQEDVLATVARLVGEVITTLSIQLAQQYEVDDIIYIGTTLKDHPVLREVIADYTVIKQKNPIFLDDQGYSGAIGALNKMRTLEQQ